MPKLTLSVDGNVVERAKEYAAGQGTSLSNLVERFLDLVSSPATDGSKAPVLSRLRGSMRKGSVADYRKYLERKYR